MTDLRPSRSNPSSVNHGNLSFETVGDRAAWEWDIVSGDVQWFGGLLPGRDHATIQAFTDMLHPDDRARWWQKLEDLMARREIPYADEYRFIHRDGSARWVSGMGRFYYDNTGKAVRMTGVVQDVTERKQAQQALRESEERFATAFRTSPHPIGITEAATGRCIEVNDACLQLFGFRRDEVIGSTTLMLGIWPNDEERARLIERLKTGEPVRNLELSFKTKSGDLRHILVSSELTELNRTLCLVTVGNDITERKQAEAKLREREERLRLAQSAANIGTFEWVIPTQEVVWSEETERMWGLPAGGFGGTYEHWRRQIHPEDLAEAERIIHRSLENPDVPYRYEHRIIRPDGTVHWIHANATTRCDTTGRPIRMVGVNFDITERKEAEAKLRESEARFRNVFEHAAMGIAIANPDGNFVQCNPAFCAMLGYTEDELRHVHFSDLVHEEDRDANVAKSLKLIAEELPHYEIENRYVHKNGEPVWVRKFISLVRDHERRAQYVLVLVTDITERRKAEHALLDAQRRLQRWNQELEQAVTAKTAELTQSQERLRALTSELNLAEQRERKRLATELHDHLQQILVLGKLEIGRGKRFAVGVPACESMLKRVDDILSDALTYSRTLVAELSPPVLRDQGLAAGLEWLAEYMNKKHGQTVTVIVPKEHALTLPEDQCVLLFQSVRELLINASKHAGTGEATVQMTRSENQVLIQVRDQGVGFDLDAAVAVSGLPSGEISSKFGLFSIGERMRALGGSFHIQSSPGQGTRATLTLPLGGGAAVECSMLNDECSIERKEIPTGGGESAHSTLKIKHSTHQQYTNPVRVLLVDDHAMVRQGLCSVLDAYDDLQVVGEARDGAEAVALVEDLRPRVVVMDINMPKMNGIEATAQIKTRWPETIVVGISVNSGGGNSDAMKRAGAATVLTKDKAVDQLHDAIVQEVGASSTEFTQPG